MAKRTSNLEEAGRIFSERLKKYPKEIQITMGITLLNVMKGCPWGITTSRNKEFMDALPLFEKSTKVKAYKLFPSTGLHREDKYIVLTSERLIIEILNKEAGGMLYGRADYEHALKKRKSSIDSLEKFLRNGKVGRIGIFSTNEGDSIVADGVNYPAFSATLLDLFTYCSMYGYSLMVKGRKISISDASKDIAKVYESLQVAPNGHALFISITR